MDTTHATLTQDGPRRSERWWFSDGNIVLQAKEPDTLFRVHQGMLSLHSSVFRDMLQVGQPVQGETIDGLPSVLLSDTAQELHNFFVALWDWTAYLEAIASDIEVFIDCLRLATKYDVAPLRKHAIDELSAYYPRTLEASLRAATRTSLADAHSSAIAVVQLVRELSLPLVLLPSALYECCAGVHTVREIFRGCHLAGGRSFHMNGPDLQACIVGYERLAIKERMEVAGYYGVERPDCEESELCNAQFATNLKGFDEKHARQEGFSVSIFEPRFYAGYCTSCILAFKDKWNDVTETLWEELPSIFDLGTWGDLENAPLD